MNKVPLKFNIQSQMNKEWVEAQENYKRGNIGKIWEFFQDSIKKGCVLDFNTREDTTGVTWFIINLTRIYNNSYYREQEGVKTEVNLTQSDRYLILAYYITYQIAATFPLGTITNESFQSLFLEWTKTLSHGSMSLPASPTLENDLKTLEVLLELHEGDYYGLVKGLVE